MRLVGPSPSYGAEIRYDFTGYVQDDGLPLPPLHEAGFSLKPGSTISGYFSYIQENAVVISSAQFGVIDLVS
jgi:hypothetical protein